MPEPDRARDPLLPQREPIERREGRRQHLVMLHRPIRQLLQRLIVRCLRRRLLAGRDALGQRCDGPNSALSQTTAGSPAHLARPSTRSRSAGTGSAGRSAPIFA
jgi:hypothetical protein